MNTKKATKRALLTSVMALVMCVVMLVGTTFAWFTDTASTGVNKIQAGTLDVQLLDENGDSLEGQTLAWQKVAGHESEGVLWEPGCTYNLQPIVIKNNGNLALKYKIQITGIQGDAELNNAIEWTITNSSTTTALDADHPLAAGASDTLTIKGHMKESAGNEYQGLSIDGIGITVYATQAVSEFDSIGNDYDTTATYLNTDANGNYLISNANELVYFAKTVNVDGETYAGKTVKLTADIDLAGKKWIPVGQTQVSSFQGTFDGQNHTIKNMTVNYTGTNSNYACGLFGWIELHNGSPIVIQNVKFDNANVTGIKYTAVVAGYADGASGAEIKNCVVTNSTVTSNTKNAGGIIGYMGKGVLTGNTVSGCTISAKYDVGGIANSVQPVVTFQNNKVENTNICYAEEQTYDAAGIFVCGKVSGVTIDDTNTATNCEIGRTVYGLAIIPNGENSKIIVNSKEGLLNLTKLFNDWTTLFTDGNGNEYGNYYNGAGTDYYYSSYWTISLKADIDLNNATIAPITLKFPTSTGPVKFEGNGKTIRNANIVTDTNTENNAGLFDARNVVMNNLKLDSIRVTGSNVHNSTAGVLSGITNCDVTNITITNSSVTGGKYTGGVVGYGYNSVKNCSLTNVTVKGGYKLGGLIGYICASGDNTSNVTGNTLKDCTVDGIGDGIFADGKHEYIIGKVVGNYNCNGTCNGNTITNMTTSATENIGKIENGKTVTQ